MEGKAAPRALRSLWRAGEGWGLCLGIDYFLDVGSGPSNVMSQAILILIQTLLSSGELYRLHGAVHIKCLVEFSAVLSASFNKCLGKI
jgi:hypothetical protein